MSALVLQHQGNVRVERLWWSVAPSVDLGVQMKTWTTKRWFRDSYGDSIKAVELFNNLGRQARSVIRQLGYPTKNSLKDRCREYQQSKDLNRPGADSLCIQAGGAHWQGCWEALMCASPLL